MRGIAKVISVAWFSGVVSIAALTPPSQPTELRILSPGENSYVSGPTLLRAAVDPGVQVSSVVFYADGQQVCTVRRRPFECDWDAGPLVVEHHIRAAATLADGGRVVASVRTRGVTHSEGVDVDIVQVTATVTEDGQFVHGLTAGAFRISEDGKPQKIASFSDATAPLDLVVAVDVSGSMAPAMPTLKAAVKEFLAAVPTKDTVTLLAFNHEVSTLARKATSPEERLAAVDRLVSWGTTALYDVIVSSVDLVGQQPGRKAVVVFTDGEDEGSHVTLDMVERRLQESDATLFMIGQGRGTSHETLKRVLRRLADPTGGRAVFTDNIDKLKDTFKDLLEDLSNQYLLGYASTNEKHDGSWRAIKVEVAGHRQVRARQGYRAKGGGR